MMISRFTQKTTGLLTVLLMVSAWGASSVKAQKASYYLLVEHREDMADVTPFMLGDGIFAILTDGRRVNGTLNHITDTMIVIGGFFNKNEEIPLESVAIIGKRGTAHTVFRWLGALNMASGVPLVILGGALLQTDDGGLGGALGAVFLVFGGAGALTGAIPFLVPRKRFSATDYEYSLQPVPEEMLNSNTSRPKWWKRGG